MGLGRSYLLQSLTALAAARGHSCVSLSCSEPKRLGPKGVVAAFHKEVVPLGTEDPNTALLAEELDRLARDTAKRPKCDAGTTDERLLLALESAVVSLTKYRPLVVTLDDAHLADGCSLRLLTQMLAGLSGSKLLFVASLLTGVPSVAPEALDELQAGSRVVRLSELDTDGTASLLTHELACHRARPDVLLACHRYTSGNPLAIKHLAQGLRQAPHGILRLETIGKVPLTELADLLIGRLNRIDPRAARLASACAIAGGSAVGDPILLAHLSDLSPHEVLLMADVLVRMGLMEDDDRFVLRPLAVRNALVRNMTLMARNAAHLSAAVHLHERQASTERIAHHLTASTLPAEGRWAPRVLIDAGRWALARQEPRTAVRFLERARQSGSRRDIARATPPLVEAKMLIDLDDGLTEAVQILKESTDGETRHHLLSRISSALFLRADAEQSDRFLQSACTVLAGTELRGWARLHQKVIELLVGTPGSVTIPSSWEEGKDASTPGSAPVDSLATRVEYVTAAVSAVRAGDPAEALVHADDALRDGQLLRVYPLPAIVALLVLITFGKPAQAGEYLQQYEGSSHEPADPLREIVLLSSAACLSVQEGKLSQSQQSLRECLDLLTTCGTRSDNPLMLWVVGTLACVLLSMGLEKEARALLRKRQYLGVLPPGWFSQEIFVARAWLQTSAGDFQSAARDLTEAQRSALSCSRHAWRTLSLGVLQQLGRQDEVGAWARQHLRLAEQAGSLPLRGVAMWIQSSVVGGQEGEQMLHQAVRFLREGPVVLELAHALARLGELQAGNGQPDDGVSALAEALQLAQRCEAHTLADRVRGQLTVIKKAASSSSPPSPLGGVLLLTARERQVLVAAMGGQTNEDISRNLHITQRTVELHLSSAYHKLSITGRKQFPVLLGRTGFWDLVNLTRS